MIFVRLLRLVIDVLLAPLRALVRARAVPRGAFVTVAIDGAVVDVVARPRFWQVRAQRATSLHALGELVDAAVADARVRGVLVTIRSLGAGMATATALRDTLARARAAGREVVVHLPLGAGTKEVLVATAATKVVLGPAAQLAPFGFLVSARYVRRALDHVGVEPQVIARGDYKAAGETFVRDSMSAPQREQLDAIVGAFHAALVDGIAEGRKVSPERAAALVDGAPYFGDAAIEAGLADATAYDDELPARLGLAAEPARGEAPATHERRLRTGKPPRELVDGGAYLAMQKRPLVRSPRRPPLIAVVPLHGAIAHGPGPLGGFATDERFLRTVRRARTNPRVRGVVVHIDSPGGSALASDRMHHELVQLAREKPVVACLSNVAASGGYYVAVAARRIVGHPCTITGSIGVIAGRLSLEPLLARVGITTERVQRGARAGLLASAGPMSDDERAALEREIDAVYRAFVRVVAEGRAMPTERVEALAGGRVYAGAAAHAVGLVDVLGGFDVAVREVRALLPADVRARAEVTVLTPPRRAIPPLDPPSREAHLAARTAGLVLGALLPASDRALVELCATGERVLALWAGADAAMLAR